MKALKSAVELKPPIKQCGCGQSFDEFPESAKIFDEGDFAGIYWDCSCGSTQFIPKARLAILLAEILRPARTP